MADSENKNITPPELPPEIILFQILPKLPAKSLLRFKCVCKQWRSFLTTPTFTKIHLHHVTTVDRRRHEKLLFFHTGSTSSGSFQTIGCEDGLIAPPRCYPFLGTAAATITSCVNGITCVGIWKNPKEFSDIILWNPLTGEYKTLSRPGDRKCYSLIAMALELYYTSSDDDYKILRINVDSNVYIYSLKSDSWRKLGPKLDYHGRIPYAGDHNSLDEKLHFLMRLETRYIIIRLDLKTEKFTKIAVPSTCRQHGCLSFRVGRGGFQLTIFKADFYGTWIIEGWKMDGDGDWTKVINSIYSIQADSSFLRPLYLMRNGNWLVYTSDGICKVDPEKDTKDDLFSNPDIVIYQLGTYIETFVSPNRYIH